MRVRIVFSKTDAMRFTGHLDLHRTLERTMRRGKLPLAYSQGFNPRPKITLASALPLGYTSNCEMVDIWLKDELPISEIEAAFLNSIPPGIVLNDLYIVDQSNPKLQTQTLSSTFEITMPIKVDGLDKIIKTILETEEIIVEKFRKGKRRIKNIRETIIELKALNVNDVGQQRLEMTLQAEEGKTGRPDDLLSKMGIDPLAVRIMRTNIKLKSD